LTLVYFSKASTIRNTPQKPRHSKQKKQKEQEKNIYYNIKTIILLMVCHVEWDHTNNQGKDISNRFLALPKQGCDYKK